MKRLLAVMAAMVFILVFTLAVTGCGGSKEGAISQEQHGQIERGMTLDQVEAIAGSPVRSHRTGTAQDPNITWYFEKTDATGLVRITFTGGKVETISPYDESVEPEE